MRYYLLTGATGLLGRYLMRDLALAGVPLAVVARGTRRATARDRIESSLADMELQTGRSLPRPVVLEGTLGGGLGLDSSARAWVARHVGGVIHNAASLTFVGDGPDGEPWTSNVRGTRNVVELARDLRIREFHHVSTAYVCGLRTGTIRESELNVGQQLGNDYETSKLQAEELVRAEASFDAPTVFRPAIIVGDSQTGFTNTFHGFYRPLQIVHGMINRMTIGEFKPQGLLETLGMSGTEGKNLVTVDWVSAVMARLIADRAAHGQTYHLTPADRTTLGRVLETMERAVHRLSINWQAASAPKGGPSFAAFLTLFRDQLQAYQSYWRDDPEFDATNTRRRAADLPPPRVGDDMLARLCEFAIRNNFWWSRGDQAPIVYDVHAHLARRFSRDNALNGYQAATTVALEVTGCGGGQWRLALGNGAPASFAEGIDADHDASFYMNVEAFRALAEGELTCERAIREGAVIVDRPRLEPQATAALLDQITANGAG